MKLIMIVNPNAGRKKGLPIAKSVQATLTAKGYEVKMLVSKGPGETYSLAQTVQEQEADGILAIGGDGTLFDVINGLIREGRPFSTPVIQIPVGTGNSFMKDLGIESVDSAVEAVLRGNTRLADLAEFSTEGKQYYSINLLGAGFVSNVAYRAKTFKALGALSYIIAVLQEILVKKVVPVQLTIDGQEYRRNALFVEICNSRYTGGKMMMAPDAVIDDGLLDIILCNSLTRFQLLKIFPSIFKGKHTDHPKMEVFRGRNISLRSNTPMALTPDGETFGSTPLEIRISPLRVRMFC